MLSDMDGPLLVTLSTSLPLIVLPGSNRSTISYARVGLALVINYLPLGAGTWQRSVTGTTWDVTSNMLNCLPGTQAT